MPNLSQLRRQKMLGFLDRIRKEHTDDESLAAISEIENALTAKKYGLVWEEHEERADVEMKQGIPVWTEDAGKEIISGADLPVHFLLEGDNLHSLRLLEKTHSGRVDLIYIDPPYNRGKTDFIYDDNYVAAEDGFRHSKWLSFMGKRLLAARELLSKKGLLFISIDDNEVAQLKMLCDEIFGESGFINLFVWKRNSSGKTEKDKFTVNTEYVLLYAKSGGYSLNPAYKPLADSSQKLYNKDDHDGRGRYQTVSLQKPRDPGPDTTYDYVDNNGKVWKCPPKGWRMRYEKIKALENDGRLVLSGRSLRVKDYWNERKNEGKRIDTLWDDLPENSKASKDLEMILGKAGLFDNPKPVELVRRCLEVADQDAVVLDFFAGSGTTGQAVLELNREDGGHRQFILCTNDEGGICGSVTWPRLRTVITGVRPDGTIYSEGIPVNLKYYRAGFAEKCPADPETNAGSALLPHIKELIQLKTGRIFDSRTEPLILTDEEADALFGDPDRLELCRNLYLSADVLLTLEQEQALKEREIQTHIVPDCFYETELMEVGER